MEESAASSTAIFVSLMRAIYSRTAQRPIFNDPWGETLLPGDAIQAIQQRVSATLPASYGAQASGDSVDKILAAALSHPALANVIVRSRYTEDALETAILRGVKQYVLIGAGFDSYALRQPANAGQLAIYEIDHPATQDLKLRRLKECGIDVPGTLQFLSADLAEKHLSEVLANSSFTATEPAFFSLLGVTMYLSHDDNVTMLGEIARSAAPASELVFSYVDQAAFTADATEESVAFHGVQQSVASLGEPFLSGFDPATLAQELARADLQLEEDLSDDQAIARYDRDGSSGLRSAPLSRIARATVVGR
jgi:methyltransferase (TIGR00027 family)